MKKVKEDSVNIKTLIKSAYYNMVTELPNRDNILLMLNDQIQRVSRREKSFIVTVIKISNYFDVKVRSLELANNFMREASDRILDSIRDEDNVGQYSDDSFVILFNEYLSEENYEIVIKRIEEAFGEKPHLHTKYEIEYEISIGKAIYPRDAKNSEKLLEVAMTNALK